MCQRTPHTQRTQQTACHRAVDAAIVLQCVLAELVEAMVDSGDDAARNEIAAFLDAQTAEMREFLRGLPRHRAQN